jgi:hypothetical protein
MSTKLTIRDWVEDDMSKLAKFHAQMNVGYPLPESFGPLYCIRKAIVNEAGDVVAMAAVKLVGEAFYWQNQDIPEFTRAKSVKVLNMECTNAAKALGLEEVSCWIPQKIARCFARIIERLGWRRSPWPNWSVTLK